MKNIVKFSILFLGFFFVSCDSDSDDEFKDEYYVKYEFSSSRYYYEKHPPELSVELASEKSGNERFRLTVGQSMETTIGPVKKGFDANIRVFNAGGSRILKASISVSKNSSPFALKMRDDTDVKRDAMNLSYKIDF